MKRKLMVLLFSTFFIFNANSQSLKIGKDFQGGTIIDLDASKKHGLVVHFPNDRKALYGWNTAMSEAKDADFGGYRDWRLPTLEELTIICKRQNVLLGYIKTPYGNVTVGMNGKYANWWTSEKSGDGWATFLNFNDCTSGTMTDNYGFKYIFVRSF